MAHQARPWHEGERQMQKDMHVDMGPDSNSFPALSPQLANHLRIAPLIAIGTLDSHGNPWTTLWGGEPGFAQSLGGSILGIRSAVTGSYDPVIEELVGKEPTGEVVREDGKGRMVSGLTIDLETRKRVKMFGRMIAGALGTREDGIDGNEITNAEVQLVLGIEESLGNCPKYLNGKHIIPARSNPRLISDSPQFTQQALDLIAKSDLFFVSSSHNREDMDTNHRGGPTGFMRVVSNDTSGAVICWPEYSGNRMYQTLGNLAVNPRAGICVPDFDTGDMLYFTGTTEVLIGPAASALLPRSNLVVKLSVTQARFVAQALPFRGIPGQKSPYNPVVRYLAAEKPPASAQEQQGLQQAKLLRQTKLTPTISRFKFALSNAATYTAGQYVTFDLSDHLNIGYSHMRDDDPRSLNDDFVRTFTVSSPPKLNNPKPVERLKDDEFEITIRRVGVVTEWLFRQEGSEDSGGGRRGEVEVGVKGFGGEFEVKLEDEKETVAFVAAGVGITPLLPSLGMLDLERVKVLWSVRREDVPFVVDTLEQCPELGRTLVVFVSNGKEEDVKVMGHGTTVLLRRMGKDDVTGGGFGRYYLCTGTPMRKQLMEWLPGEKLVFEDFNF